MLPSPRKYRGEGSTARSFGVTNHVNGCAQIHRPQNRSCQNRRGVDNPGSATQSPFRPAYSHSAGFHRNRTGALCGVPNANLKSLSKSGLTARGCSAPRVARKSCPRCRAVRRQFPQGTHLRRHHPPSQITLRRGLLRRFPARVRTNCWLAGRANKCLIRTARSCRPSPRKTRPAHHVSCRRSQKRLRRLRPQPQPLTTNQPSFELIRHLLRAGAKFPLPMFLPPHHARQRVSQNSSTKKCLRAIRLTPRHSYEAPISIRPECGSPSKNWAGSQCLGKPWLTSVPPH